MMDGNKNSLKTTEAQLCQNLRITRLGQNTFTGVYEKRVYIQSHTRTLNSSGIFYMIAADDQIRF